MTVYDSLLKHKKFKRHKGEIGLEIETESKQEYQVGEFSFWDVKVDRSLRDFGREYVLKQPVLFDKQLDQALSEFEEKTKGIKFTQDSITTSIHTHLNMLNENWVTVGNFLTTYSLVENFLMRFSGEDRKGNLFCLPISDAEENYENMRSFLTSVAAKRWPSLQFDPERTKYAALNLSSFYNFGSFEQRTFRGTTNIKEIKEWISILYNILLYSRREITPHDIIKDFMSKDKRILEDIFQEHRKSLSFKDEEDMLERNFWYASSVAYSVKDWDKLREEPKIKKPTAKDLDTVSESVFKKKFDDLNDGQQQAIMEFIEQNGVDGKAVKKALGLGLVEANVPVPEALVPIVDRGGFEEWVDVRQDRVVRRHLDAAILQGGLDQRVQRFEVNRAAVAGLQDQPQPDVDLEDNGRGWLEAREAEAQEEERLMREAVDRQDRAEREEF